MKKIFIVGAGGFGREVLWLAKRINSIQETWDIQGFIENSREAVGTLLDGYPVVGDDNYLGGLNEEVYVAVSIGSAKIKKTVTEKLKKYKNVHFATLIDPSVIMSDRVEIGEGSIICAGTILTVDITIGKYVIINLDSTVGHDAFLGDYVTVYPSVNISGNVKIGNKSEVGTGTQIIQGKTIGEQSIIGAGSVVIRDIPDKCTAVGSPAKPIKFFGRGVADE